MVPQDIVQHYGEYINNNNNDFVYSTVNASTDNINNPITCYRSGKTVSVCGFFQVKNADSGILLSTIPSGYRPSSIILCSIIGDYNGGASRTNIYPDGRIVPQNNLATGTWYTLSTAYIIE